MSVPPFQNHFVINHEATGLSLGIATAAVAKGFKPLIVETSTLLPEELEAAYARAQIEPPFRQLKPLEKTLWHCTKGDICVVVIHTQVMSCVAETVAICEADMALLQLSKKLNIPTLCILILDQADSKKTGITFKHAIDMHLVDQHIWVRPPDEKAVQASAEQQSQIIHSIMLLVNTDFKNLGVITGWTPTRAEISFRKD